VEGKPITSHFSFFFLEKREEGEREKRKEKGKREE